MWLDEPWLAGSPDGLCILEGKPEDHVEHFGPWKTLHVCPNLRNPSQMIVAGDMDCLSRQAMQESKGFLAPTLKLAAPGGPFGDQDCEGVEWALPKRGRNPMLSGFAPQRGIALTLCGLTGLASRHAC